MFRQRRRFHFLPVTLFAMMISASGRAQQETTGVGVVSGQIVDDMDAAVAAAVVTISRHPQYAAVGRRVHRTDRPVDRETTSGDEGEFAFDELPDGDYRICVDAPGYLNPCRWPANSSVKLGEESRVVTRDIVVPKGCRVRIRIDDPLGLAPESTSPSQGSLIKVGVQAPAGAVHIARTVSRDATGRDMEVTVPFDVPLKLWVHSRVLHVEDSGGEEFDRGPNEEFTAAQGQETRQFTVNVTGRRPVPPPLVRFPPPGPRQGEKP